MALFTDGPAATVDDLRRYDSSAGSLAHDAGINLDDKLAVAAEEVGQAIFYFLLSHSTPAFNGILTGPPGEARRQRLGLSDVMVTPAVRRWTSLKALAGLYRDAYQSDVTDRYRKKWDEFEQLAREAEDFVFGTGVGLSLNAVPKAPVPRIDQVTGTATGTDCVVRATWVSQGGEGAPSNTWHATLAPGDQVSMQSAPPAGVTGWNVYVAPTDSTPLLQNDSPMPVDGGWRMPMGSLAQGRPILEGQPPDYIVVDRRLVPRG